MNPLRTFAAACAVALALVIAPALSKETLNAAYYLPPGTVDLTLLLAPPPDVDSPLQQYDEKKIADALAERTSADLVRAAADAHRSVFVFTDVLGSGFAAERVPLTATLFRHVSGDVAVLVEQAKAHFGRPRPVGAPQTHGSYPSGHAAFASCVAILLSQMVPEKRRAIFERASIYAEGRIVAGVHYPSDIEAGWISGTIIAAALMRQPHFEADFGAAKAEVRSVLRLPEVR